jgi:hypothetical protein
MQKMDVSDRILDVRREVCDAATAVGSGEVIVDPSDKYLLRRQLHQVLEGLAFLKKGNKTRMLVKVDV